MQNFNDSQVSGPASTLGDTAVSRRGFLATAATAAGALVVPFHLPGAVAEAQAASLTPGREFAPNAYVRVGADGFVINGSVNNGAHGN